MAKFACSHLLRNELVAHFANQLAQRYVIRRESHLVHHRLEMQTETVILNLMMRMMRRTVMEKRMMMKTMMKMIKEEEEGDAQVELVADIEIKNLLMMMGQIHGHIHYHDQEKGHRHRQMNGKILPNESFLPTVIQNWTGNSLYIDISRVFFYLE